jgi:BirA family transcriptional regulator, biotin operon repressor / biotin---[acetyl-CoA-carboxylase] ligase
LMNVKSTDIPVLSYLSDENYITGEELSCKLGFSRVAVWKQIQKLKKLDYHISADARKGYRVISRPDILLPFEIYHNLHTKYIGQHIFYFPLVTSTNSMAKESLKSMNVPLSEGTVMIADMQTAGRGRLGRIWYSPHGGIWLTIVLFPNLEPAYISKITLMTAVVLVRSIKSLYDIPVHIKWPNDLLIEKKKLCGILTEMAAESDRINYVLVGIGVNANIRRENFPEDIREQSTSLQEISGELISRIRLVQIMLENFEKYYGKLKKKQFKPILKEWKEYTDTLGKNITIESAGQTIAGEAVDITPEGALVIRKEDGTLVHVLSGTVR